MNKSLFSSNKTDWETPQYFYDLLDKEFHFTCDVAASEENYKNDNYYTKKMDGLKQPWSGVCWCNPPYGRDIDKWIQKAHQEAQKGVVTIMLIPSRTDTKYFHEYIYKKYEIRSIKGRVTYSHRLR